MTQETNQLMTYREVAALVKVSVKTIRRMVDRGDLKAPNALTARVHRFNRADILDHFFPKT